MPSTFATAFDPRRNNFDAIRLLAASVVVLSHAYSLTGAQWEPVSSLLHYGYGGTLAVQVFFVISGFLIARSVHDNSTGEYLAARMLRILPGLAFITLVETFLIAPAFFNGALSTYFRNLAWPHLGNILVFGEDPYIPGVFAKNPYPYVNGSLWTLPIESLFYLALPILVALAAGRRWIYLVLFALSLAAESVCVAFGMSDEHLGGFLFRTVSTFAAAKYACWFMAGVVAWTWRDRIGFSAGACALALLILFAARDSLAAPWMAKICGPYVVLYIGMAGGFGTALKRRIGDLSYGTYLFGYPVLNIMVTLGGRHLSAKAVFLLAMPVALLGATLSWHFVERPFLRMKHSGLRWLVFRAREAPSETDSSILPTMGKE